MRFLLDENFDLRLAAFLEQRGHEVSAVGRDYQRALSDHEVLTIAVEENRILFTHDRDFGELVFRQGRPHAGAVYLRLQPPNIHIILSRVDELLKLLSERLSDSLSTFRQRHRAYGLRDIFSNHGAVTDGYVIAANRGNIAYNFDFQAAPTGEGLTLASRGGPSGSYFSHTGELIPPQQRVCACYTSVTRNCPLVI